MDGLTNAAPIIIKKKKYVIEGGHHGGAWKVAYADFVTAMMAFFMLMWLLSATTEKQRTGLADYFAPTVSFSRSSGGGDGALNGDSIMSAENFAHAGNAEKGAAQDDGGINEEMREELLSEVKKQLLAKSGESMTMERLLRHVASRVTDEGLVIELFDLEGETLFKPETTEPDEKLIILTQVLSDVLAASPNALAVNAHVRGYPKVLRKNPVWDLSRSRAEVMHNLLLSSGTPDERIQRVSGFADRKTVTHDPTLIRNNRVEVILLRTNR